MPTMNLQTLKPNSKGCVYCPNCNQEIKVVLPTKKKKGKKK